MLDQVGAEAVIAYYQLLCETSYQMNCPIQFLRSCWKAIKAHRNRSEMQLFLLVELYVQPLGPMVETVGKQQKIILQFELQQFPVDSSGAGKFRF